MILLSRQEKEATTDGNLPQTVLAACWPLYHCFDRIVIQGYLPLLTRPGHVVHFFRDVHGINPITKEVLAKRTNEYRQWVEAFARNQHIPIEWPQKNIKNEDYVRRYCLSLERAHLPFAGAEVP